MKKYFYLTAIILGFIACSDDETPEPRGDIIYKVTFNATWTEATHPGAYPNNAHFSPIIGASHGVDANIFEVGQLASTGIKTMAETGGTGPLSSEINMLINTNKAWDLILGPGAGSPGMACDEFGVDADNYLITVVTMIAPSPDWFIGVQNVNLMGDDGWIEKLTVNAITYDAGTDSGSDFTSENNATSPPENIFLITGAPLGNDGSVTPLGNFVFERIK